jgi:hypothetical protein
MSGRPAGLTDGLSAGCANMALRAGPRALKIAHPSEARHQRTSRPRKINRPLSSKQLLAVATTMVVAAAWRRCRRSSAPWPVSWPASTRRAAAAAATAAAVARLDVAKLTRRERVWKLHSAQCGRPRSVRGPKWAAPTPASPPLSSRSACLSPPC